MEEAESQPPAHRGACAPEGIIYINGDALLKFNSGIRLSFE